MVELRVEPAKNSGDVYRADFEGCNIDMEPMKKPYMWGCSPVKIVQETCDSSSEPQKEWMNEKNLKISNSALPWISLYIFIIWLVIMPIKQSGDHDRADFWRRRSCYGAALKRVTMSMHKVSMMLLRIEPANKSGDVYDVDFEDYNIDLEPMKKP